MSKRWLKFALIPVLVLFLAACGSAMTPATASPVAEDGESQVGGDSLPEISPEEDVSEIDAAAIFAARCARCHGADRSGANGPALLPERLTEDAAVYQATITDGSGPMPSFSNRLTADEINALVEWILTDPQ